MQPYAGRSGPCPGVAALPSHGIVELASLHAEGAATLHAEEDIHSTKAGLALSAFGTIKLDKARMTRLGQSQIIWAE